jgi:ABC-2 type transport system ATP-binding protein
MPGTLLEVRTSAPRRTAALLRERLTGVAVGLFGDRVHLATTDAGATAARVREFVVAAGIELIALRPIEPSLEDVFVSVLAIPPARAPSMDMSSDK